jgi:hypothetical protein
VKVGELSGFIFEFPNLIAGDMGKPEKLVYISTTHQKEFDDGSGNKITLNYVKTGKLDTEVPCLRERYGIYIFYDPDTEEVIYIGKAYKSAISKRAWGFFVVTGVKDNGSYIFPNTNRNANEQYKKNRPEWQDIIQKIKAGDLNIIGIEIEPKWYASLFESAALAYVNYKDGCLPPINLSF